jgi:hypothetical protein
MDLEKRFFTLAQAGKILREAGRYEDITDGPPPKSGKVSGLAEAVRESEKTNPWFVPSFTSCALKAWGEALQQQKIEKWLNSYPALQNKKTHPKKVGIVMAGNIPLVGLHDLLCILASGNHALVKLSSQDNQLIPAITDLLSGIEPSLDERVSFTEEILKGFDAVIATGSDNTSRYFEYYFGRYPHIIRKNRNGVAVIDGNEPEEWYRKLADDIFLYFGLGCRNVSKLYLPDGFQPPDLFNYFIKYEHIIDHHKYQNNYDYQKSILLINRVEHFDNGFILMKQDLNIASPVSVLFYEFYKDKEQLQQQLDLISDQVQCLVSSDARYENAVPAGKTQFPELWDYADGIDTLDFLVNL